MDMKILLIILLLWELNSPSGVMGRRKAPDDGVFEGEGCDKMQYIKSDFECPSPGYFALTRNCVDFMVCVPNAFNEYDDMFMSCELPYQYYVGEGQCVNITIAGNERENCPQMNCKIVPASEASPSPPTNDGVRAVYVHTHLTDNAVRFVIPTLFLLVVHYHRYCVIFA